MVDSLFSVTQMFLVRMFLSVVNDRLGFDLRIGVLIRLVAFEIGNALCRDKTILLVKGEQNKEE